VPGGTIPPHDASGAQHVCLAIPVASLEVWEQHLAGHGIVIESRVIQTHGGTSLYFRDPDGHSLEVATPGLWPTY
jgi:catechol 2,3-dioxygenase-like lactoylglutathione lyase family enzyme